MGGLDSVDKGINRESDESIDGQGDSNGIENEEGVDEGRDVDEGDDNGRSSVDHEGESHLSGIYTLPPHSIASTLTPDLAKSACLATSPATRLATPPLAAATNLTALLTTTDLARTMAHPSTSPETYLETMMPTNFATQATIPSTMPDLAMYSNYHGMTSNAILPGTTQSVQFDPFNNLGPDFFATLLGDTSMVGDPCPTSVFPGGFDFSSSPLNVQHAHTTPMGHMGTSPGISQFGEFSNVNQNNDFSSTPDGQYTFGSMVTGVSTTPTEAILPSPRLPSPQAPVSPSCHPLSDNVVQVACTPPETQPGAVTSPQVPSASGQNNTDATTPPRRPKRRPVPSLRAQRDNSIGDPLSKENHPLPPITDGMKNMKGKKRKVFPMEKTARDSKRSANSSAEKDGGTAPKTK